jgi:Grap2 and cyclin-D-interacting
MPSMVTAVLMLTPGEYTKAFATEARLLVKTALKEFSVLVEETARLAAELTKEGKKGELSKSEKEVITSQTGRVWDACDTITALVTQGVVGHVVRRVQEWHDLVKDAISELEEWDPEEEDADFEELLGSDDEEKETNEKDSKESDEDEDDENIEALQKQKKSLLRALKPIAQIYPAIISNRCKKGGLTASKSQIVKLESLTFDLQSIPSDVDEAAGSLYESNLNDSLRYLNMAKTTAERAIGLVTLPWASEGAAVTEQQGDKFTTWSTTWRKVMGDVIKDIQ